MSTKDHQHEWVPFAVAAFVADYQPDIDQHELDALHAVYLCNDGDCGAWTGDVLDAEDRVDADDPAGDGSFVAVDRVTDVSVLSEAEKADLRGDSAGENAGEGS